MSLSYDSTRAASPSAPTSAVVDPDRTILRTADADIATLPPIPPPSVAGHAISLRTGEPKRPVVLGVACGLLYGGAVVSSSGLLKILWDSSTVAKFPTAARVLSWVPDLAPVSFLAIVMVLLVALIGVVVAGAAGIAAYNAWNGVSWARVAGVVAAAVSLLTILLNPLAMVGMGPICLGAALLWLPQVSAYLRAWQLVRQPSQPEPRYAGEVRYGPLPRYV